MATVKDLRELINVSRLTYRESDDEHENDNMKFINSDQESIKDLNESSVSKHFSSSAKRNNIASNKYQAYFEHTKPSFSKLITLKDTKSSTNKTNPNRSSNPTAKSIVDQKDKSLLLVRDSLPRLVSVSQQIQSKLNLDASEANRKNDEIEQAKQEKFNIVEEKISKNTKMLEIEGNFDRMLTYIDASVVSEWLNRANRTLFKLTRWHQHLENKPNECSKLIKYEPFVLFANFWIGSDAFFKFGDKERRNLIEMEYSNLCDEVIFAFQVGIECQQVEISEIYRLMKSVFKEYPLQLLSFRGCYLLLDYIDILSSERGEQYKKLLSDVKCRTLNKQYAQWLLSVRSFALINLCWSIIKFHKKLVDGRNQALLKSKFEKEIANSTIKNNSLLKSNMNEINVRYSSLSNYAEQDELPKSSSNSSLSSSYSSTTSETSSLTQSQSSNNRVNSAQSNSTSAIPYKAKSKSKSSENEFTFCSAQIKHNYYLEAVLK
jgi:uncharacterized membrane-anchored protein YhcB (DUF1043 family)